MQDEVMAFLADGASHGLAGRKVERIDTHASAVFLIGERALKLKRAVRYSYLDYSTVALRETACRAEFAINRRIAPALYLGVRAIRRRAGGALGFDGAGDAVDWVVEMRRFAASGLFDRIAETGGLGRDLQRQLADTIAAFHAGAESVRNWGGSAGIARVIVGNAENLRDAGAILDQGAVTRVTAAADAALRDCAALLDRRRARDKVRRCHGDLHLGNICLIDGKPTLFDAIEFSEEISCIDVLYDLAFLLMDLVHRELGAAANFILNRYLDLTQDDEGLKALPLFLAVRAAIRAHVSAAAVAQQPGAPQRQQREDAARSYLALAAALLPPSPPRLIAVGGHSGSGKSTLALALAPDLPPLPGARVLRSDVLRKALLGLPPETRLPPGAYSHAMSKQIYAALQHQAAHALAAGSSVIMDATFLDPAEREAAALVAANAGVPFTGLWLDARREVMAARLEQRPGDASDATLSVLDQQLASDPGPITWQRIDTGGALARVTAAIRRAAGIATRPGPLART
ncbi:MAG TPA: AAA family ATPase [Stellaceae bacterium]|nr:AAA family ATPase [Stellaceae bacterium]